MEKGFKVTVAGKEYPCRQTMGAMLRFKRETGREVTDMTDGVSDLCTYLYCCVVSACMADGVCRQPLARRPAGVVDSPRRRGRGSGGRR